MVVVFVILMTSFATFTNVGDFHGEHFQAVLHLIGRVRDTHAVRERPTQKESTRTSDFAAH